MCLIVSTVCPFVTVGFDISHMWIAIAIQESRLPRAGAAEPFSEWHVGNHPLDAWWGVLTTHIFVPLHFWLSRGFSVVSLTNS